MPERASLLSILTCQCLEAAKCLPMCEISLEHLQLHICPRRLYLRTFGIGTHLHQQCGGETHLLCYLTKLARSLQLKIRFLHVCCYFGLGQLERCFGHPELRARLLHPMLALSKIKKGIGCHHTAVAEVTVHCRQNVLKHVSPDCRHRREICHFREAGCGARLDYRLLRLDQGSVRCGRFVSDILERNILDQWIRHCQLQFGIVRPTHVTVQRSS